MSRGSGWQQSRQNPASQAHKKVDTVTDPLQERGTGLAAAPDKPRRG